MPGLVPGIHGLLSLRQGVDGRVKPGHDDKAYGRIIATITTPVLLMMGIASFNPSCEFSIVIPAKAGIQ